MVVASVAPARASSRPWPVVGQSSVPDSVSTRLPWNPVTVLAGEMANAADMGLITSPPNSKVEASGSRLSVTLHAA